MSKNKQAKAKQTPHPSKTPKANEPTSDYDAYPAWRVSQLELADLYGWHTVTADELKYIQEKLKSFETMTWREILASNGGSHRISSHQICKEAQERLEQIAKGTEELVSLRLEGKIRVWGVMRHGGVLSLLWYDPEHAVYPVSLKYT